MQEPKKRSEKQWLLLISLICVAGLILRLYLFFQAGFKIDYDEAMIALNARHFMFEGKLEAFVPGQSTLANIEAYLLSPFFLTLGANTFAVRVYSLTISTIYILTSGYLGREVDGNRAGIIAALLAAIAPAYFIITGSKIWGSTIETMVLGNLLFISISQMAKQSNSKKWAAAAAISSGLMFWCSWLSIYYFIPATIISIWKQKAIRRWIPLMLVCFFIGSLPLWIHNFTHNFESFQTIFGQTQERGVSRIDTGIKLLSQFPVLITGFSAWASVPTWTSITVTLIYVAGMIALAYHSITTRSVSGLLCLGLVLTIPLIYIQSGYGRSSFNSYGVDSTGRYLLMFHTALPIGIAVFTERVKPSFLRIGAILLLIICNLSITLNLNTSWAFDSPYYNRQGDANQLQEVANYLLNREIYHVWTDVGIGQPLMFISEEQILAADYHDYVVGGIPRFPEALQAVWAAPETAFLVAIIPNQGDTPLSIALDQTGVLYETQDFGTLRLYLPETHVNPESIVQSLGLQY